VPATLLSHQAIVLPLKMRWPHLFSGLALCIGSMAPDLEFIGRLHDDWLFSHTLGAQVYFTVPVTALLLWVLSAVLLPALLPYLPNSAWWRPHDLASIKPPRSSRDWMRVLYSAWIGGMSHVMLDGITHGNHSGWLVPWLPVLRTKVWHFGTQVPLHDALQLWCTVGFAIATIALWRVMVRQRALWRWQQVDGAREPVLPSMPRADGMWVARIFGLVATAGALAGHQYRLGGTPKLLAAGTAFGAINAVVATACVVAMFGIPRNPRITTPPPA
jgi:hypothetical protein